MPIPPTRLAVGLVSLSLSVPLCGCQLPSLRWPDLGLGSGEAPQGKQIVGAVETLRVDDVAMDFATRIDTGAQTSAIHATDIQFDMPVEEEAAAGRRVEFTLENERGQRRRIARVVADVVSVRTANGIETRLRVPLRLSFRGQQKSVLVSLRDRGSMTYKLIVGRDWLADGFLVDVTRDPPKPPSR